MKSMIAATILVFAATAFADQSITCHEATKAGAVKANGGTVKVKLKSDRAGQVKVTGFTRGKNNSPLSSLSFRSVNESADKAATPYTTFFFDDAQGMLDVQLQFDARVLNQNFRSVRANFVVGSDDANPETGFALGFDVLCNGRVY